MCANNKRYSFKETVEIMEKKMVGMDYNQRRQIYQNFCMSRMGYSFLDKIRRGNIFFKINQSHVENDISEQLQRVESKLIEMWKSMGYNETEIEKLVRANTLLSVKNKSTFRNDKKLGRKLLKEVQLSFLSR
jgi:hypothetical protein